jgi:hypothetical protein
MRTTSFGILAACAVAMTAPAQAQIIDGEGTYQTYGDQTEGPNGPQHRYGNQTYTPRGSYQTFGNTTYGSDGTTFQRYGNTTYGNKGTTSQTFGNTTNITGPNGSHMTCQRFGTMTDCN